MDEPFPPIGRDGRARGHIDAVPQGPELRRTRDRGVIRAWADRHSAEPATGEATASGPATVHVNDGGAGIRFNFPGVARFRPIAWEEWFDHFDTHQLTFAYEVDVPDRAHDLFKARGEERGHEQQDWFEAEQQLPNRPPSHRYRLIRE